MKFTINIKTVFITAFFSMVLLGLPIQAHAAWGNAGMAPNFNPNQIQPSPNEVHVNQAPLVHFEPLHHTEPSQPKSDKTPPFDIQPQPVRLEKHPPEHSTHDYDYHKHHEEKLPYIPVTAGVVVPDGFEAIVVDGQTYYYSEGVFYQLEGDQLVAIPPVIGAVVDYIPQDYQVVMLDGASYLLSRGIYYVRVAEGFEVIGDPTSDQE